jgi:hypothetical protein
LVIRIGLALRVNFVENSTKITLLEITGYRIRHNFKSGVVERFRRRYVLLILTTEFKTAIVAYFQRKIQLIN